MSYYTVTLPQGGTLEYQEDALVDWYTEAFHEGYKRDVHFSLAEAIEGLKIRGYSVSRPDEKSAARVFERYVTEFRPDPSGRTGPAGESLVWNVGYLVRDLSVEVLYLEDRAMDEPVSSQMRQAIEEFYPDFTSRLFEACSQDYRRRSEED